MLLFDISIIFRTLYFMLYSIINFSVHGDHKGKLVALEKSKEFPFEIKRVYYVWDTACDAIRGRHAHKNLEQIVICMSGSCDFLLDDGSEKATVHLDSPTYGLYIKKNIWGEFTNFSDGCVVMVLASDYYNPDDYIHDYNELLKWGKK